MTAAGGEVESAAHANVAARAARRRAGLLDVLAAAVALLGLADALYLTVGHMTGRNLQCLVVTGCDEVLRSDYATLPGGVPLAALGLLAYFTAFSLATLSAFGHAWARTLLAALVALMLAFTLWLLYLQAFVLRAFCTYCLLSAAFTTTLAVLVAAGYFIRSRSN